MEQSVAELHPVTDADFEALRKNLEHLQARLKEHPRHDRTAAIMKFCDEMENLRRVLMG
jgi:hypothetical protein